MPTRTTTRASLRDAKAFVYRSHDEAGVEHPQKRWIVPLAVAAIPLSLPFGWGVLHLMLVLEFPRPANTH